MTTESIEKLKEIKSYFGKSEKTIFQKATYEFLDKLIKEETGRIEAIENVVKSYSIVQKLKNSFFPKNIYGQEEK